MGRMSRKNDVGPQYAACLALNDSRREIIQAGIATLSGGTVTVSNAWSLTANSIVRVSMRTPGGAAGFLSAPSASYTPGTSFVINSSSGTDTSVVFWEILNPKFHADVTASSWSGGDERNPTAVLATITAANGDGTLPTLLALCAQIAVLYPLHIADALAHRAADGTNTLANAAPVDLASAQTFLNDVKTKYNLHIAVVASHYSLDTAQTTPTTVSAANATNQATADTLANAIKASFNLHIQSAPAGASVQLISA